MYDVFYFLQLKKDYKSANNSLNDRARNSEGSRERAQALLSRASSITVDTTNKLKDLQGNFIHF